MVTRCNITQPYATLHNLTQPYATLRHLTPPYATLCHLTQPLMQFLRNLLKSIQAPDSWRGCAGVSQNCVQEVVWASTWQLRRHMLAVQLQLLARRRAGHQNDIDSERVLCCLGDPSVRVRMAAASGLATLLRCAWPCVCRAFFLGSASHQYQDYPCMVAAVGLAALLRCAWPVRLAMCVPCCCVDFRSRLHQRASSTMVHLHGRGLCQALTCLPCCGANACMQECGRQGAAGSGGRMRLHATRRRPFGVHGTNL